MRATDSNLVAPSENAARFDAIDRPLDREAGGWPSYVESVLFGRKRTRGTRPLPALSPLAAKDGEQNQPSRAHEQERN
jgi:hypothetical protein